MSEPELEDEVSFVDLIAVLLRRRWIIIGSTVVAALIGLILIAVLPAKQLGNIRAAETKNPPKYKSEILFTVSPSIRELYGSEDLGKIVLLFLQESSKSSEQVIVELRDNSIYSISAISDEADLADRIVNSVFVQAEESMARFLKPAAETAVSDFNDLLDLGYSVQDIKTDVVTSFFTYKTSERLLSGTEPVFSVVQDKVSEVPPENEKTLNSIRNDLITKTVISVAAVFILSIFFVFILQAIENVKKDPEAVAKLRSALGRRK